MSTSRVEPRGEHPTPLAVAISVADDALAVDLSDGRTVTVPLGWYPRLVYGSPRGRRNWRLIGAGDGIHWPDLDEDISVEGILAGRSSEESQASFRRWRSNRGPRANRRIVRRRGLAIPKTPVERSR